jgi:hypothetical protein
VEVFGFMVNFALAIGRWSLASTQLRSSIRNSGQKFRTEILSSRPERSEASIVEGPAVPAGSVAAFSIAGTLIQNL